MRGLTSCNSSNVPNIPPQLNSSATTSTRWERGLPCVEIILMIVIISSRNPVLELRYRVISNFGMQRSYAWGRALARFIISYSIAYFSLRITSTSLQYVRTVVLGAGINCRRCERHLDLWTVFSCAPLLFGFFRRLGRSHQQQFIPVPSTTI